MCRDKVDHITDNIINEMLIYLQEKLAKENLTMNDFLLPIPVDTDEMITPRAIREETNFDTQLLTQSVNDMKSPLNEQQRYAYDEVMKSVNNNAGKVFCLSASGGSGKTHLLNLII